MPTTDAPLANARRWAAVIAIERQSPAYIVRRADGVININLTQRETAWIDGSPLTLLETVQP
jgi:hypothetical protein